MAIYHLRATMISRSSGRSATGAAAYRSGADITDERTGLRFDYSRRSGVEHVEILAPDNAPDWVQDRSALWNAVELAETRKNSQVAREIRVALPSELSAAQHIELVRGFCQRQFVDHGMVADIAIHAPGREGDERNHHAHIMLTTREIGAEGFTVKNRDWNAVERLEGWREAWAVSVNHELERANVHERVDHRTLQAQHAEAIDLARHAHERGDEAEELRQTVRAVELDREPLPQLSAGAWQMKQRGHDVEAVRLWREVKERAAEVYRVAQTLAGQVRDWWRGLEHQPALGSASVPIREAQSTQEDHPAPSAADRLRDFLAGISPKHIAESAAEVREMREASAQQRNQQAEQQKEHQRAQQQLDRSQDRERSRGGWDFER